VYARSVAVVALCTLFVVSFALVLGYEAAGIGKQSTITIASQTACTASGAPCEGLTITSAKLRTVNYTDELGTVSYANLSLGLNVSGGSPVTSVKLFIGNQSAGEVQGPFKPGINKAVNVTIPSTVSVSKGKTYLLSVEGYYGNGLKVWTSTKVTAE
jgi:hypothetical protein